MCRAFLQFNHRRVTLSRDKRDLLQHGSQHVLGTPRLLLVRRHATTIPNLQLRPEDETLHDHSLWLHPWHICKRERVRICM